MDEVNAPTRSMRSTLDCFVEAFNVNDLDQAMVHFADNAVYRPGDGTEYRGPAAIRRAFEPQFQGAFGSMRFDEYDRIIDEVERKAVIRWVCRHDLAGAKSPTVGLALQKMVVSLLVGRRFGWEGVDIFHFDEAGKILGKFTYANYTRPRLSRSLGMSPSAV
jgi:hypothetical protein